MLSCYSISVLSVYYYIMKGGRLVVVLKNDTRSSYYISTAFKSGYNYSIACWNDKYHAGVVRRWPCRSGYVIYIYIYIYIVCRSGTLLGMQECRHAGVAIKEFRSDSSLAMQEWLYIKEFRSDSSLAMQEWLVVGHAGVARLLYYIGMQEWLACRSGSSLAMQEWLASLAVQEWLV